MSSRKSPMERMNETCAAGEMWWDSSPLVFETWKQTVLEQVRPERQTEMTEWYARYYVSDNPMEQLFRGVTTNPPLTLAALKEKGE